MQYIIILGIVIAIIYGIIKLLIWLVPIMAQGALIVLGAGAVVGMIFGVVLGIRSYILSINKNISSRAFRVIMTIITSVFILAIFIFLLAFIYYYISNL